MKAIVKTDRKAGVEFTAGWPEPEAAPKEVVVEITAAAVCGTDLEAYNWTSSAQAFGIAPPVVMGHEAAGVVVDVGADVDSLRVGYRVALESHFPCGQCFACRVGNAHLCERTRILGMHLDGVFAERVAVPASLCFRLPDSVSDEVGSLLESAGVAMHAIQRSGLEVAGQAVLVSGAGPVGAAIALISSALGAVEVLVVEPNPYRRARVRALGAAACLPTDLTAYCAGLFGKRGGFDVAFEASGAAGTLASVLSAVRADGTVVAVGHPGKPTELDVASTINKRGITLKGVFGRRLWDTWERLGLLVAAGRIDLSALVSHRLPLEQVEEAMTLLRGDASKILLVPNLSPGDAGQAGQ